MEESVGEVVLEDNTIEARQAIDDQRSLDKD